MTERLGPPPVENLSQITWARVERNVFSRMDGTVTNANGVRDVAPERRSWLWLAVPAVAAAACGMMFFSLRGHPASSSPDEDPARVVAGESPSTVSFGDAHITLDARSAIVMSREADRPTTLLENGAAWFAVAPRGERPPFVVLAGDATVRVIGTRFRVAREGEHAEVQVDHGTVEVRFHGSEVRLTANQRWTSEHPTEVAAVAPEAAAPVDGTAAAPDDEGAIDLDPVARKRAPKHVPAPHRVEHAAAAPIEPPLPVDPDRTRYEALTKLEAKHPETAMKGYLALSQGASAWSEVALYAAARLAVDRHDSRAQTLLTIYLRRFPNGANVDDARQLMTRLEGDHP